MVLSIQSKQQWDLFVRTLMAAGLPQPTRIELSASNRDLSDVLSSLAAAAWLRAGGHWAAEDWRGSQ